MVAIRVSSDLRWIKKTAGCYTWTVPSGVSSATIKAWGAGGARRNISSDGSGGGSGFQTASLSDLVPGSELKVYVGHAGTWSTGTAIKGGAASFVARGTDLVVVSAGGGAAGASAALGGRGSWLNGFDGGNHPSGSTGGKGGTLAGGGVGGDGGPTGDGQPGLPIINALAIVCGLNVNPNNGGAGGATESARGGGGYNGGGGGAAGPLGISGAGGGASLGTAAPQVVTAGPDAANNSDFDYLYPAGRGATDSQAAQDGLVVISYTPIP